jgi:anti-sigma factor RsiW
MTEHNSPVTEDELHAYVDGELPADRQDAVANWLATHADAAAQVAAWRAQAEAIRARYSAVTAEPVPERLALDKLKLSKIMRGGRSWAGIAAAAAIAAFLIGGAAGWMARGASAAAPDGYEILTSDALTAHRLYIGEVRHPVEVGATEAHLLPWLSRRVGTSLRAPELGAFDLKLLGGRLLPGINGPAALFMYESSAGERYTLFCAKLTAPRTALRYSEADKFAAVQWVEAGYGYVVSGPQDKLRLKSIAKAAYEQMENRPPAPSRSSFYSSRSLRGS